MVDFKIYRPKLWKFDEFNQRMLILTFLYHLP